MLWRFEPHEISAAPITHRRIMRAFDRSRLPIEVQQANASLLDRLEKDILAKLQDADYRWATSAHEASHFHYRQKVGDSPFFLGPFFSYNEKTQEIGVAAAGVKSESKKFFECLDVARWDVAGWIWEQEIAQSANAEDGARLDRSGFNDIVRTTNPNVTDEQIQEYWDIAEADVRADLGNIEIRNQIEKLAHGCEAFLLADEPVDQQMSSDSETRISIEVFHRHFIVTHLKEKAAEVLDEIEQRARESGEPLSGLLEECVTSRYPGENHLQEDNWYATDIPLDGCYFAHTDFRGYPVPKDERFVDFMRDKRDELESGSFPCSLEIRAPWPGSMPEPLVREREPGKFYILDGQMRVIWHWYHNVPTVRVFIYRGKLAV
jgi:hypothetical protein